MAVCIKERLASGEKAFGTMLKFSRNPSITYLAKNNGLDFVMYDCEHAEYDMTLLHDHFAVGKALGLECFVRVPQLMRSWISRVQDQGATGVMVPMCSNREMAEEFVKYAKYEPIGERGFSGSNGQTGYRSGKHRDLMNEYNSRILSIAQIETVEALENLEEIASTEGIDVLLVGPNDLSISLGIPGDVMNPLEIDAIRRVGEVCRQYHKLFGIHSGPELLKRFKEDLNIVMVQTDADFLNRGFASVMKVFDD